ncbi:spinster family MFS transporter [Vibrio alfacsensis]|uniref:spinster family MFS transporter n=1 Tax=Vibrio alfacsensis TaxID=1074311 RepID=UPI001BEE7272|nr:MFS transporter [Vibrio alfacsensis]BCN27262.1 MFS transporter [Vibrio alfacsensis]
MIPSSNNNVNWRTHTTLLLLALIYVFSYIDRNVIAILIEPIKQEFGASDTMMGLLSGLAFATVYSLLSLPLSHIADKGVNRRNMVAICCGLWSIATVLCGAVQSFWTALLARMGVAVGEAGGMAPSISMLSELYPKNRRSLVISIFMMGPHLGLLLAMIIGGWIAQEYGWRMVFFVFGAPGIVLAVLLYFFGIEPKRSTEAPQESAQPHHSLRSQLSSIIAAPGFIWLALGCALAGTAGYGYVIWAPTYLVRTQEMSLASAGLIFGIASGVSACIGSLFSGVCCDRLVQKQYRWQILFPMLGILLSFPAGIALILWPSDLSIELLGFAISPSFIFIALFAFFNSWWPSLSYAAVSQIVGSSQRASAAALLNLFLTLFGAGLGPLLTGGLSDYFGDNGLANALLVTFSLFLLSAFFYLISSFYYRPVQDDEHLHKAASPTLSNAHQAEPNITDTNYQQGENHG